jgi:hypothetical protein
MGSDEEQRHRVCGDNGGEDAVREPSASGEGS